MDTTFTPMNSSNLNYDSQQAVSSIDKEYPHKLHGILRHTEGTKLRPDEEICVVAIVPPGRYLVQVENHDLISGPLLSFSLMVAKADEQGRIKNEVLFEDECTKIGSKASPVSNSFYESRFEVASGHALVWTQMKNTGSWRGCKASIILRGTTVIRILDYPECTIQPVEKVAERIKFFSDTFLPHLLKGEHYLGLAHPLLFIQRRRKILGTLYFTNYQLIFAPIQDPEKPDKEIQGWQIPFGNIARLEWGQRPFSVRIHCRSFAYLKLRAIPLVKIATNLHSESESEEEQLKRLIESLAFPTSVQGMFPFIHGIEINRDSHVTGWDLYNVEAEFKRQKIDFLTKWRITEANQNFELCDTYPRVLVVPRSVTDEQLKVVAAFRSRGRIPVVVWKHPTKESVIVRCSQPLSGFTGRCEQDEMYFQEIRQLNTTNPNTLYIFDARPSLNAWSNSLIGKGFEDITKYQNCKFKFLDIDNIQAMNKSLKRLREICLSPDCSTSMLASADWLTNLTKILVGAGEVVNTLDEQGASVIVHCSDGWDRTAQLTSLPQLCLDPYYRSLMGFVVLIEKEWLSFGHQFGKRIGFTTGNEPNSYWDSFSGERGPIFLQFIDCVHQLLVQYPMAFEFNDKFLLAILYHLYSCRYGTFLLNSEKERVEYNIKNSTLSVWALLDSDQVLEFINPKYDPSITVINPSVVTPSVWTEYYLPGALVSFEQ